jgi:hypothetical protein
MMKIYKGIFLISIMFFITACLYKPFQPPLTGYEQWIKKNVGHEGVKKAMRDCGFKNVYGYSGGKRESNEDIAKEENCMFKNGFQYDDNRYKGICSLPDAEKIAACHSSN